MARPIRSLPHVIVVVWGLGIALADAAPTVEIRAKTALSLTRVRVADEGSVDVAGQLVDKLTQQGIPGQVVHIAIGDGVASAVTTEDGSFHATVPAPPGPVRVTLAYGGDRSLDRADSLAVATDPGKQTVEIGIEVSDDPAGAKVRVTAAGDSGPMTIPIALAIAPQQGDAWTPIALDSKTFVAHTVARRDVGGPGLFRVRATFAGDVRTQSAAKEIALELRSSTTTEMQLSATRLAFEDRLGVTGRVVDADQHPIANAAVVLTSADRTLAHAASATDGTYSFSVKADSLGEGRITLQVEADPGRSYLMPSRSAPKDITVSMPQPVPVLYTVAGFVATGVVAAAFFVARRAPWRNFRRRQSPADESPSRSETEAATGGLVAAKPSIVSALRRASDDSFSGVVRDSVRNRPIANAIIRVAQGQETREAIATAHGSFALPDLGIGAWHVEVTAPGHVTERFAIALPHRGEFRGVHIDLVPVREKAFQLYRRVAEPILPNARLWGIWSPRQIVDHVRARRPSPALEQLTDWVEEIYFSPRITAEDVLTAVSDGVDRAHAERHAPLVR